MKKEKKNTSINSRIFFNYLKSYKDMKSTKMSLIKMCFSQATEGVWFDTEMILCVKKVDCVLNYLHCMGLLGMLEMDDTEEQGIFGTVK